MSRRRGPTLARQVVGPALVPADPATWAKAMQAVDAIHRATKSAEWRTERARGVYEELGGTWTHPEGAP